jgi:hypothetical protein
LRIQFQIEGEGEVEVHLWPDKDGLPITEWDLMPPVTVAIEEKRKYYMVSIEEQDLQIEGMRDFHVGIINKRSGVGAKLCYDATKNYTMRAKYSLSGEWVENERDWFVRVYVDYLEELETTWFSDVTEAAGFTTTGRRIAWGDYNNDGASDVLLNGRTLFKNNGDGTFTDVSEGSGLEGLPSNGGLWGDFNNDGNLDIFAMVSSLTEHDRILLSNGDGTFSDITLTALVAEDIDYWPTEGAGIGDYNKDGFVDIYLANYEMPGDVLSLGTPDKLYRNNGDGTFTDVAADLDIDPGDTTEDRMCGRGVNFGDFNNDGWPDIHVSNYRLDPNFLYMNNGDGTFTEVAEEYGVQGYEFQGSWGHTIGSMWGDFNNDGYLDLFNANLAHPRFASASDQSLLYINNGPPTYDFTDFTQEAQIIFLETNSDPSLGDFNNDGWIDVLVTNTYDGYWAQLYRNDGDATMTELSFFSGLDIENGWGGTWVDYDNDGYLDMMAKNPEDSVNELPFVRTMWRNNGNDNNWLKVKLACTTGDPFCIGARVEVQTVHDGGPHAKEVISGKGTTNSPPFELHFGLNQCETAWRVTVKFMTGEQVDLYEVAAGQTLVVTQDDSSDVEPTEPGQASTCADVDYAAPQWPDPPEVDDDDDSDDDDDESPPSNSGSSDDDDDEGCGC